MRQIALAAIARHYLQSARSDAMKYRDKLHAFYHLVCLVVVVSIFEAWCVYADSTQAEKTKIRFSVRTIQANNTYHPSDESFHYKMHSSTDSGPTVTVSIDKHLRDIREKLLQLPFSHFHLISDHNNIITLKKKNRLTLPNNQVLFFKPIYVDGGKIGLWLNWKDHLGREMLNTRLHFNAFDSIVTGTNDGRNTGIILAIKAAAIE